MVPPRMTIPPEIDKFVEAEGCQDFNYNRYYITQTQIDIINAILKDRERKEEFKEFDIQYVNTTLLFGPSGTGKAQPLYSKILTPDGFKEMGDIGAGDIVISGTGKECRVSGVYPQQKRPIFEITFDDGGVCRCSDNHLWTVQDSESVNPYIYQTRDLLSIYYDTHYERYRIDDFFDKTKKRYFKSIEYIGKEECQCIYIDDPSHLYVTDDYIITHNTTFARFIAYYLEKDFVYLNFSSVMEGGFGNTEKNLRDVFRYMTAQDCVFMIDEIDCIATSRTQSSNDTLKSITVALMQELDHCKAHSPEAIILAATNVLETLDPALLTRFSVKKEIPLLNNEDKAGFLFKYMNDLGVPYDKDQVREYVARSSRITQRIMEQDIIRALGVWLDEGRQGDVVLKGIYNY